MVLDWLRSIDIYGGSVGFTFKGETRYKTVFGGICSFISIFSLLCIYTLRTVDFLGKLDTNTSMYENFQNNVQPVDLHKLGYRFAISAV